MLFFFCKVFIFIIFSIHLLLLTNMQPHEYENDLYLSYVYDLPPFDPWIQNIFQIAQVVTYCFFTFEEYI